MLLIYSPNTHCRNQSKMSDFATQSQYANNVLPLSPSDWTSIYIPYLPHDLMLDGVKINSEETLRDFFENKVKIGVVSRVDFVKKQSAKNMEEIAVFVHFSSWTVETGSEFRRFLDENKSCRITNYFSQFEEHRLVSSTNSQVARFITIKINHTPIKEVTEVPKNMHQIVNNYGLMEALIDEQRAQIMALQLELSKKNTQIEELEEQIEDYQEDMIKIEELEEQIENYQQEMISYVSKMRAY